jgi:hypothetical protein
MYVPVLFCDVRNSFQYTLCTFISLSVVNTEDETVVAFYATSAVDNDSS